MKLKKVIIGVLSFILFFIISTLLTTSTYAQDFRTNYKVEYLLNDSHSNLNSQAKYTVNITNLKEGFYVSKFTLSFPRSFSIDNITASDDVGLIEPEIIQSDDAINIELTFNNPNTEIGSQNNFYLTFNQQNLFNINGNIWEVILPVMEKSEGETYQIQVTLPANSDKKISISKPAPTTIAQNTITWINPSTKTIYAVFGDSQLYDLKLDYNIYNPKITNGYIDVAFPPDTPHQRIYLKSINPAPSQTYIDEDGNFIGRYILKPRENKQVKFEAIAQISAEAREEVKLRDINLINIQKKYLLNQSRYWTIDDPDKYKNLQSPLDIYNFLTSTFEYDYSRISKDIERLGAEFALKNPKNAVCTEFSDAFVAISREKGIFAREIQGYGFSDSPELRPLSLIADVLHSWPQYYNLEKNLWVSVDPTWENTSGIDYFSSF
ncbi:MAG: transglutaminase-like domain-containing protein, partial [Patescibacteria group bacterium]